MTDAGRRLDAALEEAYGSNPDATLAIIEIEREAAHPATDPDEAWKYAPGAVGAWGAHPATEGLQPLPAGVSDGLSLACSDCGERPRFDYHVSDEFWRKWVPDMPACISVVCLPCLDKRCDGVGLAEALGRVDWTGTRHTVSLQPSGRYLHDAVPEAAHPVEEPCPHQFVCVNCGRAAHPATEERLADALEQDR